MVGFLTIKSFVKADINGIKSKYIKKPIDRVFMGFALLVKDS